MPILTIKRNVTDLTETSAHMIYYLNGVRVWVGFNTRGAHTDNHIDSWYNHEPLIHLICGIGRNHNGIHADMTDPIIVEFLILTKCI